MPSCRILNLLKYDGLHEVGAVVDLPQEIIDGLPEGTVELYVEPVPVKPRATRGNARTVPAATTTKADTAPAVDETVVADTRKSDPATLTDEERTALALTEKLGGVEERRETPDSPTG